MKKINLLLCFLILSTLLISQENRHVLIIGIDGCRSDALEAANTPNIDALISEGIYSPDALNDDITISGPGWSAIVCGVWSEKHLVTGNNFSGNDYENYPSIFKLIDEYDTDLHTVSICHWGPINDNIVLDHADFKLNVSSDWEVANQAVNYLSVNDPDLMFLHLDDVDVTGHSYGFSPSVPEYISVIETIDAQVGFVIEGLEARPNYEEEEWLILLTTDHGGIGTSHGGSTIEEETVFYIASGMNIDPQIITKDTMLLPNGAENCLMEEMDLSLVEDNDYITIPNNPIFDFGSDQDFTIECRVQTNESADVAIVGNKDWDSGNNKGFVFSFKYPSGPEWKVNIGDGSNRADINTGGLIADGEWYTLSVSFDRDGWMKMYQDGAIVDSADISFIGDITTNQGLFFGSDINQSYDYDGKIAEVRVWNKVVDGTTINDWHCQNVEDTHPDYNELVGYWKMNEGEGDEIFDSSINGNNGVAVNTAWTSADSLLVFDYSQTPRLVDIPVTALTHLCIPIDEEWDLDGKSWIDECMISNTSTLHHFSKVEIFPNPAKDEIQISLETNKVPTDYTIKIVDTSGKIISQSLFNSQNPRIDISNLKNGVYYLNIEMDGELFTKSFVKLRQ